MDFFNAARMTTHIGPIVNNNKRPSLPTSPIVALPMRANDILIISTDPRFRADYCRVHTLSHYKPAYATAQLVPVISSPLDYCIFDVDSIGDTI